MDGSVRVDKVNSAIMPVVSVCVITYNHGEYIRQCLDSVLAQRTRFPYEVLVGEDESSDGTREIVLDYQRRFPEVIKVLLHSRKDVIYVNGRPTGRRNYFETLAQARGKYIAFVEGDDFWMDSLKMQMQVDLMESRPDLAICGHWNRNVDDIGQDLGAQSLTGVDCPQEFGIRDAMGATPLHASSWVFRRFDLRSHPAYALLLKLPAADDPMMLVLLGQGGGYCIRRFMSAYRLHPGGTWSSKSVLSQEFEMLQFRLSSFSLLGPDRFQKSLLLASLAVIRFGKSILAPGSDKREVGRLAELTRLAANQNVLTASQLLMWSVITLALLPVHVTAFIMQRITDAVHRRRRKESNHAIEHERTK